MFRGTLEHVTKELTVLAPSTMKFPVAAIRKRHPVAEFERGPHTPFLRAAVDAQRSLTGTFGFEPPSWQASVAKRT